MARKFKFCIGCRRTITEDEFGRGLYAKTPRGLLCATCAKERGEELEVARPKPKDESVMPAQEPPEKPPEPVRQPADAAAPPVAEKQTRHADGGQVEELSAEAPVNRQSPIVNPQSSIVNPQSSTPPPPEPPQSAGRRTKPSARKPPPVRTPSSRAAAPKEPAHETPAQPEKPGSAQALEDIRQQIERLQQGMMFERSSAWNVLAVVAQCLAAGILLIAVFNWLEKPLELLVVALIFQVMALTFFVKGK